METEPSLEAASGDLDMSAAGAAAAGAALAPPPPPQNKKLRAKRMLLRQMSKDGGTTPLPTAPRTWKNTRRPRNGFGLGRLGHAKKGGAGGKFVWGKPGSELDNDVDMDANDPNYDSDSIDDPSVELKKIIPEDELRTEMDPILQEYLLHGDTEEARLALSELSLGSKRSLVAVVAIEIALDHKPSHREMTSILISDLYGPMFSTKDVAAAFDTLLRNLGDLSLDTPDAATVLGNFLARAIADDCLPPKAISTFREQIDSPEAKLALTRADTLLSMRHGLVRLDNVWGVGGGLRPVKYLVRQMNLLLKEYVSSSDLKEAARCLQELEVPHFHHELVYEAVLMVLETIGHKTEEAITKLLKSFSDAVIITPDMMERGMFRVFEDMGDIVIDVPLAYSVLDRFIERCSKVGIITEEIVRRVPQRGRKRFVSEGDGGRIKDQSL